MAKVSLGAIIVEARGSVGSQTYSKNRFGSYVKARTAPTYQNTSWQAASRARITTVSQHWSAITESQRNAWRLYAEFLQQRKYKFNEMTRDAYRLFLSCNINRLKAGQTILSVPGAVPSFPAFVLSSVYWRETGHDYTVFGNWNNSGQFQALLYASAAVPAGVSYAPNFMKFCGARQIFVTDRISVATPYFNRYGAYLVTGDHFFVRCDYLHVASGLSIKLFTTKSTVVYS